MKKSFLAIIAIVVIGAITAYAIYPYFTESTINEALPEGAIYQTEQEDSSSTINDAMMEKAMPGSYSGTFVDPGDGIHDAEGDVFTVLLEDGSSVLRLENFKTTNGPDLFVYLSTDENASDFINLGVLKANIGNQNYEIPNDANLEKYNKVLIWCKSFSVLFGSAELSS